MFEVPMKGDEIDWEACDGIREGMFRITILKAIYKAGRKSMQEEAAELSDYSGMQVFSLRHGRTPFSAEIRDIEL